MIFWCCTHALFSGGSNLKVWVLSVCFLLLFTTVSLLIKNGLMAFIWGNQNIFVLEFNLEPYILLFFFTVVVIGTSVFSWAEGYMLSKFKVTLFFVLLSIFVSSMLLLLVSESFLMLFLGWEGLGVSSFLLIMYYQNWMSAKGAMLTLMTNRLGDSILLVILCYWLSIFMSKLKSIESSWILVLLVLVSCTKSAQWPFINWLPAAMAAPTPVSALVHSSTLVTAGVWLLVRFSHKMLFINSEWLFIGSATLLVASMTALSEKDAKKVVALSTLSQLGLMFLALGLGNFMICLFHILAHALAKANLFMVVGDLLHKSLSQQDMRYLATNSLNKSLFMSMSISIMSLTGLVFSSGFFSKEQILTSQFSILTSVMSWLLLMLVSGLTLAYCYTLVLNIAQINSLSQLSLTAQSKFSTFPMILLSFFTILAGWILNSNFSLYCVTHNSFYGWYWSILGLGVIMVFFKLILFIMGLGFYAQNKMVDYLFLESIFSLKRQSSKMESSNSEILFLLPSLEMSLLYKYSLRIVFVVPCFMLLFSSI